MYILPKKIELTPSRAKWQIQSTQSVLVVFDQTVLKAQPNFEGSMLDQHLISLTQKAKALDIPILFLNHEHLTQGMIQLGEWVSANRQIMIAGRISAEFKSVLKHISTVAQQLCVVNDAIVLENHAQHLQWIDSIAQLGWLHTNTQNLTRLWSLSAPAEFILSQKGILLALAEQLNMDALEIDPHIDLRRYGLDSVGIVNLVGLWRANGAEIRYECFEQPCNLVQLFQHLGHSN